MKLVTVYYTLSLIAMLAICTLASFEQNVFDAAIEIASTKWGIATLMDVYFAFLTIILWITAREKSFTSIFLWSTAILTLGNLAIASYVLKILWRENPKSLSDLFLKRSEGSS